MSAEKAMMLQLGNALASRLRRRVPSETGESIEEQCAKRLKIRTEDAHVIDFKVNSVQKRYLQQKRDAVEAGKPPRFLVLKSRRMGITTLEQGISYLFAANNANVSLLTLAQDDETTGRIFGIARMMHDLDPSRPAMKGTGNRYRLEFPYQRALFYISSAGSRSLGRGDTLQRIHWSEVAWSCLGHNQAMKQRALLTGMMEAGRTGEIVLETTPNGAEMFRELYTEAKGGQNAWTPIFLPWWIDERYELPIESDEEYDEICDTLDDEERRLVETHGVNAAQLKWRRAKRRELKHLFYQEYPDDDVTCWVMSGVSYFNSNVLLGLRDMIEAIDPLVYDAEIPAQKSARQIPGGYEIRWSDPDPSRQYVAGVDTSEGLPRCDPNGIGIMDKESGDQVCSIHGSFTPTALAEHCCRAMREWDCLMGIERENHGHAVIQRVIDNGMGRSHLEGGLLYHTVPANTLYMQQEEKQVSKAGWSTNSVTRPVMLEGLRDWIEDDSPEGRINDLHFIHEAMTFKKQPNGKFAGDSGSHDDTVMKWAIANQMRHVSWRREQFRTIKIRGR